MKVNELIKAMMPEGSRGSKRNWRSCPLWPPDVFAVAATLVDRSAAYTRLSSQFSSVLDSAAKARYEHIASCWAQNDWIKPNKFISEKRVLQKLWGRLVQCKEPIYNLDESRIPEEDWILASLELMITADSACAGIGFGSSKSTQMNWIQRNYLARGYEKSNYAIDARAAVQRMPYTACECIADSIACVQPKTRTPGVGCTLRSMTHHLALLPPAGVVRAHWNYLETDYGNDHAFNLLVIPFPYHIPGGAFQDLSSTTSKKVGGPSMFGIEQTWMNKSGLNVPEFVVELVKSAQLEVGHVDGILLPELALNASTYALLQQKLCEDDGINVQFLISGVLGRKPNVHADGEENASIFTNTAVTTVFKKGGDDFALVSLQKKHHRWKLDEAQIRQYSIGDALNPEHDWWENANICDREMSFYTFRSGACFTTLVCEDLARADPGQDVIRAIGPNLVFALLMDGPQTAQRWPGRYAMGLADDPGSSVLSITSQGLIRRSNHHYNSDSLEVALWRDPSGTFRSLKLPKSDHALVLTLTQRKTEEFTLDGRSDGESAYHWLLSGCLPVRAVHHTIGIVT